MFEVSVVEICEASGQIQKTFQCVIKCMVWFYLTEKS